MQVSSIFKPLFNAIIWCGLCVALIFMLLAKLAGLNIETNILALLPSEDNSSLVSKALAAQQSHSQSVVFLIGGETVNVALANAQQLQGKLLAAEIFSTLTLKVDASDYAALYTQLLPYRFRLISAEQRQEIQQAPDKFLQQTIDALYSPLAAQRASSLPVDPLFTYGSYLENINRGDFELFDDTVVVRRDGLSYILLRAEMAVLPVMQGQKQLLQLYKNIQAWSSQNNFPLYMAGLALHNAFGAESAEKEISTVGLFSMVSIILLVVLCFRSATPLFLAILSVAFGVLAGFTVSLYFFTQLHIITLVFGSSLIGISIDYAFHYFADFFNHGDETASQRLARIFPGISLGMLSSVLAYFALTLAPFPGLRQIAVFSAVGLIAAWCSVVLLMPFCLQKFKPRHELPWQGFYKLYNKHWPQFAKKYRWPLLVLLTVYCLFAWLNLQPVDDIREIQQPKAELLEQEESIKRLLSYQQDSQFFIVKAATLPALWQQERLLIKGLQQGIENGDVGGYSALSDIYPSHEQQQVNIDLLDAAFFQTQGLRAMLELLGMDEAAITAIENEFAAEKNRPLSFEHWLAQMPEPQQKQFLGCEDGFCASVVHLNSIKSLAAMQVLQAAQPALLFVDPIANINSVLFHYRSMAAYFILLAAGGITLLLMIFLGLRSALIIISAPLLSILLTVASLYYLQVTFSLFNVFALLLVLGISLDYAIFQHLGSSHKNTTALAILLSLVTTFMAFGILALSSTAVIQAFGLSLAIGIACAFLIAALLPAKTG